jgi:predicted nucleotidyltransferase
MEKELSKQEILFYLNELNDRLAAANETGRIIIVGGAALALVFGARNSTRDIDAVFEPKSNINRLIAEIADDYGLDGDWLNDGAKGYILPKMKTVAVKQFSNLSVESVEAEGLLVMKLMSARALSKDMDDAVTLMEYLRIESAEELFDLLDEYVPDKLKTVQVEYFTTEAFEKYKRQMKNGMEM